MRPNKKWFIVAGLILLSGLARTFCVGQGQGNFEAKQTALSTRLGADHSAKPKIPASGAERTPVPQQRTNPTGPEGGKGPIAWVTVQSSYAVPLGHGRIKLANSSQWMPIEASEAWGLRIPAQDDNRIMRFPGYEELVIPSGPGDYEIHPESSLTFLPPTGAPSPQVWDHSLQEWALPEGARASQLIQTDAGIVLISNLSTDPRCKAASPLLQFQIELESGWLIRGTWAMSQSTHHEYYLGPEQAKNLDTSDLTIKVWSPIIPQVADNQWLWRLQPDKSPIEGLVKKEPSVPWGALLIEPVLGWPSFGRFQASGNPIEFEDLFLGGTYLASVRSRDWSKIGHTQFDFDGSAVSIEAQPGWFLEADLVDAQTEAQIGSTPARLDMDFSSGDSADGSFRWNGNTTITTNHAGHMSTSLLTKIPLSSYYPWIPPSQASVHFKLQGYEPIEISVKRHSNRDLITNIGRVDLVPLRPSFRLRLQSIPPEYPNYIFLGTASNSAQSTLETWRIPGSDQLFGARIGGSDPESDHLVLDRIQLASARSEGLVLSDDHGHLHACIFLEGIWQEVPSKDWGLPVHMRNAPAEGRDLRIGYNWRGVDVPLGIFRDTLPEWTFNAPLEGVEIWVEEVIDEAPPSRRPPMKLSEGAVLNL